MFYLAWPAIMVLDKHDRRWPTEWLGIAWEGLDFAIVSLLMFSAWAIVGAWRVMALELQVRTRPRVWSGFIGFATLYIAGFFLPAGGWLSFSSFSVICSVGFLVSTILTYLAVWWEPTHRVAVQRPLLAWQRRDFRALAETIPVWLVSMALALLFAVALLLPGRPGGIALFMQALPPAAAALGIFLLMLRDIAVLHFFALSANPRRAGSTTLLYLVLVWLVLPWLLTIAGLEPVARLILPNLLDSSSPLALMTALAQAALAVLLLRRRWQAGT
jgi:hypothetical protein